MPLPFKIEDKVICKKELDSKYKIGLKFVPGKTYTIKKIDFNAIYRHLWIENIDTKYINDGSWFSLADSEIGMYNFYEYFYSPQELRKLKLQQLSK